MKLSLFAQVQLALVAAIALGLNLAGNPSAQAQSVDAVSQYPSTETAPRFTSPDAPAITQSAPTTVTIRREQAPLPLQTVLQTPIEQFEPAFADVSPDHWAYAAVTRLFYSGIVNGYPATP